jgi:pimeloyl-ACP methyl ester carboxylesterase
MFPPVRGVVVFVHGLWMTGAESLLLRRRLAREGYLLRVFVYSSVGEAVPKVAARCADFAAELAARHRLPVHFVGHSLGGLVLYRMFDNNDPERAGLSLAQSRVVFLGTPAVASRAALRLGSSRIGRWLMGARAAATELLHTEVRRWRFAVPLGVIAGDRGQGMGRLIARMQPPHDGTVEVAETRLDGLTAHCVLPVTHSGLLLSKSVGREVASFLSTGAFSAGPALTP